MRCEFAMSDENLEYMVEACKPVVYIVVGGIPPRSPQENANDAWMALGEKMGFKWDTVQPVAGKSSRFFTAEPT